MKLDNVIMTVTCMTTTWKYFTNDVEMEVLDTSYKGVSYSGVATGTPGVTLQSGYKDEGWNPFLVS